MGELSNLTGLGATSELMLNKIGIKTKEDLEQMGPVRAYIKLKKESDPAPHLNFLFAMLGALKDDFWFNLSKEEKEQLLFDADGFQELKGLLSDEGIEIEI